MNLTPRQRQNWLRYIRAIRRAYPPPVPTTIRLVVRADPGVAWIYADHAVIRINRELDWQSKVDTLNHEYAHVLDAGSPAEDCHGETWGCWYARVYRVIQETSDKIREERGEE